MSELSPRAGRLVELGRVGDQPGPEARDRVRARLMLAVGTGVAASAAAKSAAAGKLWAGTAMVKLAGGVCAIGMAVGGASWVASMRAPDAQPPTPAHAVSSQQPIPSGGQPAPAVAVVPADDSAPSEASRLGRQSEYAKPPAAPVVASASAMSLPAPPASTLEGEIRLLREAQAAMSKGDARRGLALLQEHASQYPNGAMSQERDAAMVIALCRSGRSEEARSAATRFLQEHPDSPMTARVRGACAR